MKNSPHIHWHPSASLQNALRSRFIIIEENITEVFTVLFVQDVLNSNCLTPDCTGLICRIRIHGRDGGVLKEVSNCLFTVLFFVYVDSLFYHMMLCKCDICCGSSLCPAVIALMC